MPKKLTLQEFLDRAIAKHGSSYDYSEVEYINSNTKVKIRCDKHGVFELEPKCHMRGTGCAKCYYESNRITLEHFKELANKVHEGRYSYDKVVLPRPNARHGSITITCREHGDTIVNSGGHLAGTGCMKCYKAGKRMTNQEYIEKAKKVHGGRYNYSLVNYKTADDKVTIICPEHGAFEVIASKHTNISRGCGKCSARKKTGGWSYSDWEKSAERSKNFDSFKLYIIRCFDDKEDFVKVGKTFMKLESRFNQIPYQTEVISQIIGTARYISELEQKVLKDNKNKRYTPLRDMHGKMNAYLRKHLHNAL